MPRFDISLVPGMDRELPGHLLHGEGVTRARVLNNLRPERGELGRRPGLKAAIPTPPTRDGLAGTYDVVHIEELNTEPDVLERFLLLTEKEMFIGSSGSWTDITPTHTTGTVTVTNGSPTVTGLGTAWVTRGIHFKNWFKGPDGVWHDILSVDSNTQITLSTNYSGATLGGQAYTIKRTFELSATRPAFTQRINDDLYVAGNVGEGFVSSNVSGGAVLKVARAYDGTKTSFSPADVTYILGAQRAIESGVDFTGNDLVILGFGALSDGRLVVVGQFFDIAAGVAGGARIYYSSHLNPAVWTTTPGGATDIIDYQGAVTGASFSTVSIAIHFDDGIEVGELTGQDDPPLRFRPSRARVGAIGPRMIQQVPSGGAAGGSDLFIGADLQLYSWNGVAASPVRAKGFTYELVDGGNEIGPPQKSDVRDGFSVLDTRRNEVAFFVPFGSVTQEIRYGYDTGEIWRGMYSAFLNGGSPLVLFHPNSNHGNFSAPEYNLFLCTTTATSWVWTLDETKSSDDLAGGGDTGGIYALFEGISFGPETEWVINEILVYCRAPLHASPAETTWKVLWYADGKPAGETLTAAVTPTRASYENDAIRPEYVAIVKGFDEVPVRELSFILASNDDNVLAANITRITIFASEPTADVRAT